jgi:hypothetical protein
MADTSLRAFLHNNAPDLDPSHLGGLVSWEPFRPKSVRWLVEHGFFPVIEHFEISPRNADGVPEVDDGAMLTIDWVVAARGAKDAVVWLTGLDASGNSRWVRRGLPLAGKLQDMASSATTQYVLYAQAPSQGIPARNWPLRVIIHGKPPAPPPMGVGTVAFYNCVESRETIHIWLNDLTAGTGWIEQGVLASQYDSSGTCPATGAAFPVSLQSQHDYIVVTVSPSKCGGENDPTNRDCQSSVTSTLVGLAGGPVVSIVVS